MKGLVKLGALALVASMGVSGAASAASISPQFQTFGDLAAATFGGSGIPTDPTAFSTFTNATNGDQLTLGLSATQRFVNPALGNDGAGTYTADAGLNDGTPGSAIGTLGTTWNFNWFISINSSVGSTIDDFGITLLYDMDPGVDTDETLLGSLNAATLGILGGGGALSENSQNLAFSFLASDIPGFIVAPAIGGFNPLAGGEYSFALRSDLGDVAINVNVAAIPAPAALPLFGIGLGGVLMFSRWKGRKAATS